MGRRILDPKLLTKVARKLGKKQITDVNKIVSRKAAKLAVSSEAALIILAKEHGIGTAAYQRRLDSSKQAEVRDALPALFAPTVRRNDRAQGVGKKSTVGISKRAQLKSAIEYLIQDNEMRERCGDILLAASNFDRPVNQATLVLEDRIRKKSQPIQKLVGENLVGYAFNENLSKTVLRVASNDPDDQRGFTQMLRGTVPAFRNKTHHHIINNFSREEAMRVCGFIDTLLRVVDNSVKVR